jgi:tyrosyl-tRNA synthetase
LNEETLQHNLHCQRKQLEKFLDFNCGDNAAEIVNNYDWFKNFSFLEFIRDVGKHITVNYMMAKDSVKNRLENGMSFTEFSYQLVQGYDFYYLNQHKNCMLQMGGSDQWGNIVTGTELIRRKSNGEAYALTTPLIKKSDGTKFGKTEGGNVWLDANRTSVYKFYQFWLNASDADTSNYIRIFTLKTRDEIEALEAEHAKAPHLRLLQKALAQDITTRVHSAEQYEAAVEASDILFGKGTTDTLRKLSNDDLQSIFEGVPQYHISKSELNQGIDIITFVAEKTEVFPSKGEARKMLQGGGVFINKNKIEDATHILGTSDLIGDKYIIAQKGKKNYYLITVE